MENKQATKQTEKIFYRKKSFTFISINTRRYIYLIIMPTIIS